MFYLIWVVILLAGVSIYGIRKRTRILSQFMSLSLVSTMAPGGGFPETLDQRGASHCGFFPGSPGPDWPPGGVSLGKGGAKRGWIS